MRQRRLHIAAYDVTDDQRRRAVHRIVRGYASGAQKSVYECVLSPAEQSRLLSAAEAELDLAEDRFFIVALEPRGLILGLGRAVVPTDIDFRYFG